MIKKAFFVTMLCLLVLAGNAQEVNDEQNNLAKIQAFLYTVANEEMRADVILSQHVLLEKEFTEDRYDYLEASIDEIRLNLRDKDIKMLEYIPFNKLPRKETKDIDPEGKPTDKMYFIKYKGRQLLAIYLDKDKIASFTLVSKGNNLAHFVTY